MTATTLIAAVLSLVLAGVSLAPRETRYYLAHCPTVASVVLILYLLIFPLTTVLLAIVLGSTTQVETRPAWLEAAVLVVGSHGLLRLDASRLHIKPDPGTTGPAGRSQFNPDPKSGSAVSSAIATPARLALAACISWLDEISYRKVVKGIDLMIKGNNGDEGQGTRDGRLASKALDLFEEYVKDDGVVDKNAERVAAEYFQQQVDVLLTHEDMLSPECERARASLKWFCVRAIVANRHY